MDENEIVQELSITRRPRATLYLSHRKIEQLYVQTVGQITEFVRTIRDAGKLSASLLKLLGAELSTEKALAAKVSLSPILQAILIQSSAHDAIDLSQADPTQGRLLNYTGPGHITLMDEPVLPERVGLPAESCASISLERQAQEKVLRFEDDRRRTLVLAFETPRGVFASVASTEWVDFAYLASYGRTPPFGILGRLESTLRDVTLLDPFWIWHDGW